MPWEQLTLDLDFDTIEVTTTKGNTMITYNQDDLQDPTFVGIYCEICNDEIGYEPCPTCESEE